MASGEVSCSTAARAIAQSGGCGATAGPVVDLARGVSGDACEGGPADVGAGKQGGKLGM